MKKFTKEYIGIVVVVLVIIIVFGIIFLYKNQNKVDYKNEIAKQDLVLKCQEIYNIKHEDVESYRYNGQLADTIIWSSKTKTCLAYYNVKQQSYDVFLFEVWDYTNTDLVLSYSSENSDKCVESGINTDKQNFVYKFNKKLEGAGCGFYLRENGIDLLTNFENAMLELGFKK